MALFNRLLGLSTGNILLEDFFTEIVAYLLNRNREILYAWLKHLHLLGNNYSNAHVLTQRVYDPLAHHDCESRVDIVIELEDETDRDILFIESKVGSPGDEEQLIRYAEILDQLPGFRHKFLLFITRDFDPMPRGFDPTKENIILKGTHNVQFKQFRWHQFYQFLCLQKNTQLDTILVQETISFMEEKRMAHNNQFSSVDILALANFPKSLKMMEEAMWGKVSQKFQAILGINPSKRVALTGLQNYGRYLMTAWISQGKWWCGLGFNLTTSSLSDYPTVYLILEVAPNSPYREEIIKAMKDICSQFEGWQGHRLLETNAWSSIIRRKSLREFLAEEDHIAAIEKFFLEALEELNDIKQQYPQFPWLVNLEDGKKLEDDSYGIEEAATIPDLSGVNEA